MNIEDGALTRDDSKPVVISLIGGAAAGLGVDVILFPLDTLKTRLQSQYGFWNSGGFRGIYKGIGPLAVGSPISAALFFGAYDTTKRLLITQNSNGIWIPVAHMCSASVAEVICCVAKVPMEIIKQRRQASIKNLSTSMLLKTIMQEEGFRGFYRGFGSTIIRDVPFSIIEFPIWEWLKTRWRMKVNRDLTATEVALCGAVAGGIAAAVTTPLDVVKTQIMLADSYTDEAKNHVWKTMRNIYLQQGFTKLFAGFVPRISMIMLGGGIFFGIYERTCLLLDHRFYKEEARPKLNGTR